MTDVETRLRTDLTRLADHLLGVTPDADADGTTTPLDEPAERGQAVAPVAGADVTRSDPEDRGESDVEVVTLAPRRSDATRRGSRWIWSAAAAAVLVVVIGAIAVVAAGDRTSELGSGDVVTESTTTASPAPVEPAFVAGEQVSISVQLYSGRQDPAFVPTAEEQAQLVAVLGSLPRSTGSSDVPPQLGFRGFAIQGLRPSGSPDGLYRVEVWGQAVVTGYDPVDLGTLPSLQLDDPDGELFELLVAMAAAHLSELDPSYDEAFVEGLRDLGPRSTASTTTTIGYDRMPALVTNPGPEDAVVLQRGRSTIVPEGTVIRLDPARDGDLSGTIDPRVVWSSTETSRVRGAPAYRLLLLRLTDTITGTVHPDGTVGDSRDRRVWALVHLEGNAPLSSIPTADDDGVDEVEVPYDIQLFDAVTGELIAHRTLSEPETGHRPEGDGSNQEPGQR